VIVPVRSVELVAERGPRRFPVARLTRSFLARARPRRRAGVRCRSRHDASRRRGEARLRSVAAARQRRVRPSARKSLLSHSGPQTSTAAPLSVSSLARTVIGCSARYRAGRSRSFAAAVADDDRPAAGVLYVEDACHELADRACEMPSRLEDERRIERVRDFGQPAQVGIEVGLRAAVVGDAKSSAGVESRSRIPSWATSSQSSAGTALRPRRPAPGRGRWEPTWNTGRRGRVLRPLRPA